MRKILIIAILGFCLIPGMMACTSNASPAATSAGFVNPKVSPTPSETPMRPSPTKSPLPTDPPAPTVTRIPTDTPQPSAMSPLAEPTPTTDPPTCQETSGRVEEKQLESELLDEELDYLVYLPPCYDYQTAERYPVIYLFHGQTYSNTHWLDLGAAQLADQLITAREASPFIMVFPYDRDHYIPPPDNQFGEAVLLDLIPAIDQEYRTHPERSYRAIGGISRGGNWAVHIGLQNPELFSAIGAHSTPVFSSDTNPEISAWLQDIPLEILPRFFVDTGKNDRWRTYTFVFEEILSAAGVPHEWHLYPGFHEDAYWQAHLEEYLRWYVTPWRGKRGG